MFSPRNTGSMPGTEGHRAEGSPQCFGNAQFMRKPRLSISMQKQGEPSAERRTEADRDVQLRSCLALDTERDGG